MWNFYKYQGNNSFYKYSSFINQKILILVPHEDDEINLIGATLVGLSKQKCQIKCAYLTNGDFGFNGETRLKEALNALQILGVKEEDVIFFGFGDNMTNKNFHIYNCPSDDILNSSAEVNYTYGLKNHPDYSTQCNGIAAPYSRKAIVENICHLLKDYKPDIIFCIDFDFHADHRALSLFFEEALCILLKETGNSYFPIIYKGFAYSTAWFSKPDFYALNILSTVQPQNEHEEYCESAMDNPFFNWEKRIRFPIPPDVLSYTIRNNPIYYALKKHKSQTAQRKALSIINGDQIFWGRNTNSLSYQCEVSASSGNIEKITDFKLMDSWTVLPKRTNAEASLWIPAFDDKDKHIRLILNEPKQIHHISIYENPNQLHHIEECKIKLSNGQEIIYNDILNNGNESRIVIESTDLISHIDLWITKFTGNLAGIAEIEIYDKIIRNQMAFIKLMENNNFVYNFIVNSKQSMIDLQVYYYDGLEPHTLSIEDDNVIVKESPPNSIKIHKNSIYLLPGYKKIKLKVCLKDNMDIYDEIIIMRWDFFKKNIYKCLMLFDWLIFKVTTHYEYKFKRQRGIKNEYKQYKKARN
ncbi:PIG-L family deacetylase [Clostridium sp. AN503]|uniref:PIG-L family deacetylase n=1 Tax=Clostridium sp. AN503 TaxID=3160598 RepID=UPI00345B0B66